jgi:hypothetical protein
MPARLFIFVQPRAQGIPTVWGQVSTCEPLVSRSERAEEVFGPA